VLWDDDGPQFVYSERQNDNINLTILNNTCVCYYLF